FEAFDLGLVPDTEIMLIDEANILDRGDLDKDESEAAKRIAAQMHQMEIAAGVAGLGAVMDHRRHDEAGFQLKGPGGKRVGKQRPRSSATIGWCITHWRFSFANVGRPAGCDKVMIAPAVGLLGGPMAKMARKRKSINRFRSRLFARSPCSRFSIKGRVLGARA